MMNCNFDIHIEKWLAVDIYIKSKLNKLVWNGAACKLEERERGRENLTAKIDLNLPYF